MPLVVSVGVFVKTGKHVAFRLGLRVRVVRRPQVSFVGFLQFRLRARGADAAGDLETRHPAIRGRVVVRVGVRRPLASLEERSRRPVVQKPSAVRARLVLERLATFDALIEQLQVATRDGDAVERAGDGHGVAVHVAHVDGAREDRVIASLNQGIAAAQRFPHGNSASPADGEGVTRGRRERSRLRVAVGRRTRGVGGQSNR